MNLGRTTPKTLAVVVVEPKAYKSPTGIPYL